MNNYRWESVELQELGDRNLKGFCQFVEGFERQVLLSIFNALCAFGERRRVFIAKHEAILLHEAAEDVTQLLGRDFREAVKALGASNELMSKLNAVSSELNQFWQTHREFLGTIRKAVVAHRDQNALLYVKILAGLKPLEVMERAAEFSGKLGRLVGVLVEIGLVASGPASILQDVISSGKKKPVG